jgi:5'-3' exonuclease
MGIPSLFRTLVKKYPDIHYWNDSLEFDHLYLDYNCLIHHCKSTFVTTDITNTRQIEEEFITHVINYTSHIVCDIVKPRKLVYIAIDGPVPMTKIIRQRARRYKKVQDSLYKQKMCDKYNVEKYNDVFDSNKITPGTTFMSKLCSRLKNFIMLGTFSRHLKVQNKQFSVFLSDANIPGEGEQKIYDFMKNNKGNPTSVIYGLDADLIVLSMKQQKQGIRLLREPQNTSTEIMELHSNTEFIYFDIDKCKESLLDDFGLKMYPSEKIIDDITALTFFGGNDFVDPFVHTKMKDQGFDKLLVAYKKTLLGLDRFLIENNNINFLFVKHLCENLMSNEDLSVKQSMVNLSSRNNHISKKTKPAEAILIEMSKYEHSYYVETQNPFHDYYKKDLYAIDYNLPHESWKKQYNKYYFGNIPNNDVCYNYLKILDWNWKYYTDNNPPDWLFHYKYAHSPLCSDLHNYLSNIDINDITFSYNETVPLSPFMQLLIVLPPQNANLLPFAFNKIINSLVEQDDPNFPKKFKLDVVKGLKNIYSEPILPEVNLEFMSKIVSNICVSEPEHVRNVIRTKPFFFRY